MATTAVSASPVFVSTHLNYYLELADGGTDTIRPGTAGDKLRKHTAQPVQIHDIRGREDDFDLDTSGFQLVRHVSAEKTFDDDAKVKADVYEEVTGLLREVTGATRVHPFSHITRRHSWQSAVEAAKKAKSEDVVQVMNPAMFCHVGQQDQSYTGAKQVLRDNMPAPDAERLSGSRWGIINVWRPIAVPVLREPLAVCDARTVPDSDLRPVRTILPQKGQGTFDTVSKGAGFEIWNLAANPEHKWYYASEMGLEECLLIKCFDSKQDGRARRSPHSAFQVECQDERAPMRQSIEVRCLVFWEDQETE